MIRPIYLDYNATTPVAPEVIAAMTPYFGERYGNPSSAHAYGYEAHEALEAARTHVAALLHCQPDEVVFTGGGSESNNLAIKGAVLRRFPQSVHVITSAVEHPSVQNTCRYLAARFGTRITEVPVDRWGMVNPDDVVAALTPDTVLVSIMLANNEVGTLQPIGEIARRVHERAPTVLVHSDAAQAVGKIPVDVSELAVDLLTVAAHKLYGPKGVGALFVRRGVELDSLVHGAGHEAGRRAGTENVAGIVGLGMAARLAFAALPTELDRIRALRDRLQDGLCAAIPNARVHGHPTLRLPNTLNIAFPGTVGGAVLMATPGVAASTGSACHSATPEPSAVLLAMGVPPAIAVSAIRLSLGRYTTEAEIEAAIAELAAAAQTLSLEPASSH
jgi:cysteine desulfurase